MSSTPNTLPTIRKRRPYPAAQIAKALGVSERTVRRRVAESREDYEQRAAQRRAFVAEQRARGVPLADIAAQLGATVNAVKSLHKQARRGASHGPR